jgi:orotidine-5'-phosphate decarboxylase
MTRKELFQLILRKKSFLCVGLDPDITKFPVHMRQADDAIFEFNKAIIDATHDLAIAYKPNLAFYESLGIKGIQSLIKTMDYLEGFRSELFLIADAKRGDIGNTSAQYAKTFFGKSSSGFDFDAVTVAPYMGKDSVVPFLDFKNKWVILLALTSNKGAADFQSQQIETTAGKVKLFEHVLQTSCQWGNADNMMYVVGATQASMLQDVRNIVPDNFLLIPGVGAQGGSLEDAARYGMNDHCGLIVNASRSILYASADIDFADKARSEAFELQKEMESLLKNFGLL